jgi:hypothetical protein
MCLRQHFTRKIPAWASVIFVSLLPAMGGGLLNGVDDGARTRDLHLGKVMLFHLSYVHVEARLGLAPR